MDSGRFSQQINEVARQSRSLLYAALAQIKTARELRQTARNLRQVNADFRDFLRENMFTAKAKREHWLDQRPF